MISSRLRAFFLGLMGASLSSQSPTLPLPLALEERDSFTIQVPSTAPSGVSNTVDHGYPAFAMSQHSFFQYAGNLSSPNTFSANLIQTIATKTGTNVHIRVGGTSGDFSTYNASQTQTAIIFPPGTTAGAIPKGMTLGPPWFEGFAALTAGGIQYMYDCHFANNTAGMQANSVAAAQEAVKYIQSGHLEALEIGNEINFYPNTNRPANYNVANYITEWKSYADAITSAIGTGTSQNFEAPVIYGISSTWSIQNIFAAGQSKQGYPITSASLHHYMDSGPVPVSALQTNYMNHTRIASELSVFKPVVAYLAANYPNTPLHLGEVNSNTYSSGNADILGVFGSCLWLADYMLYGMTLNIKRMNVQQSTGFSYTSWVPVYYWGTLAEVHPPYYAHPFVADIIGNSGNIRIADLGLGQDTFSAYGIYDASSGKLKRVVLLNLLTWKTTDGTTRPSRSVTLQVGSTYTGTARVDKLTAPGADIQDPSKISWNGTSWTFASNGMPVQGKSTSVFVRGHNGKIGPVSLLASEAVVVTL